MRNDTSEQIRKLLFKNPDSDEAKDFMKEVEDKLNDASLNHKSMDEIEELFDKIPEESKNENKVNIEDGLDLIDETIRSIIVAKARTSSQSQDMVGLIKNDKNLREIQKIEKLIVYYNEPQLSGPRLSEEEIKKLETQEKQLSIQLEADKKLLAELKKAASIIFDPKNKEDWHTSLTEKQIAKLFAEGKTPGSQGYNIALREFGIDPASYIGIDKEIENKKKEIEKKEQQTILSKKIIEKLEKQKKIIEERDATADTDEIKEKKEKALKILEENIKKEKEKVQKLKAELSRAKVELIALEDQKLDKNWDPRLTEAQKEDLKIARFYPGSQEYNMYLREHGITPVEDITKLEEKIKQEEQALNDIKTKLGPKRELENLKEIKEAYEEIKNTVISEVQKSIDEDEEFKDLSGSELIDKEEELINDKIANHEKIDTLKKWSNSDKLNKELKEDIKEGIRLTKEKGKAKNEGKNEKLWLKALSGAAGFVAGIGVNMAVGAVPVLGTGLALYSGARLLYNTGKLACSIATKINNGKEPKWISSIKSKIPEKVKKAAETIFNKPKNPYAKWFVNGMSLGYTLDRIFNIHGKIGEALKGNPTAETPTKGFTTKETPETKTPETTTPETKTPETKTPETTTPETTTPETKKPTKGFKTEGTTAQKIDPIITPDPITPDFTPGDVMDISGLEYGYAGPGQQAVHLLNERGIGAVFDKMEMIGGQEWIHFKQANGAGYAWFPKEQVEELLTNAVKRGGRH